MLTARNALIGLLVIVALVYAVYWMSVLARRRQWSAPTWYQCLVGFVTDFLDTLGIGSFAVTTALYRPARSVDDRLIPGTLNVGHALPTVAQALFFITAVNVGSTTLWLLIMASMVGAWFGARIVARLPRRAVQIGMGCALVLAAVILLVRMQNAVPKDGLLLQLTGWKLAVAIVGNTIFGALMTIGVGAYAPIMVMVNLLGMEPKAAFPIMMGSCAFLMPTASWEFIRKESYSVPAALGLTIFGIPGVILAATLVKELDLVTINWLVLGVVVYTAVTMLLSGYGRQEAPSRSSEVAGQA